MLIVHGTITGEHRDWPVVTGQDNYRTAEGTGVAAYAAGPPCHLQYCTYAVCTCDTCATPSIHPIHLSCFESHRIRFKIPPRASNQLPSTADLLLCSMCYISLILTPQRLHSANTSRVHDEASKSLED